MSAFYEDYLSKPPDYPSLSDHPSRSYINAAAGPSTLSPSYGGLYSSEHMSASMADERFGDAEEEMTQPLQSPYRLQPSRRDRPEPVPYTDYSSPRSRLPSSSSLSTGRRAPAPAALDLSPQSAAKMAGLGYGQPPVEASPIPSRSYRPLPQTPAELPPAQSAPRPFKTAPPTPAVSTMPHVPLSAGGNMNSDSRPSIDSYYRSEYTSYLPQPSQAFTPIAPDPTDIDRRGLIGVGELATPRWPTLLPSSDPWPREENVHGLGVDASSLPPSDLSALLSLESFADFSFDADMAAALAASLAISEEPLRPRSVDLIDLRTDPPVESSTWSDPKREVLPASPPRNPLTASETIPATGSPGSARSRIYARRQAAALAQQAQQARPPPPEVTPPTSAESSGFARRTPPNREREAKTRYSPSSAHHDILKHFAPKDFSHLPPSPSSASIKQFLKGSGSVQNIASIGTPSYFPSTMATAPSKSTLQRSNSGKLRTLSKSGGVVDTDTAEALRKLDGLGNGKKAKAKMSAGTPPKPRSATESPLQNWYDVAEELPRESPPSLKSGDPSTLQTKRGRRSEVPSDPPDEMPPVPPLPKGYVSVKQEPYVPQPSSPPPEPRKALTKKWSFSSALSLKVRDPSPTVEEPQSEIKHAELPIDPTTPLVPIKGGKRLTPSSIPFFRRGSSSSTKEPETIVSANHQPPPPDKRW